MLCHGTCADTRYVYQPTEIWTDEVHQFDTFEAMEEAIRILCDIGMPDFTFPADGLIEGRDYEIVCVNVY